MSNLGKELTLIYCDRCGQKIVIMKEFIKPKMFCTIRCMDAVNFNGNMTERITC